MAAGERPGRRDDPARRPRGPGPGCAVVSRQRPGHRAGPGRLPSRLEGCDDPGLPAGRAPAVRNELTAWRRPPTFDVPDPRSDEMQYLVSVIHDEFDLGTPDEM